FEAVGQTDLRDFPQRGVRLLRRRRVDTRAHAALLRALLERRHLAFRHGGLAALPHELIDRWHPDCPFRARNPAPLGLGSAWGCAAGFAKLLILLLVRPFSNQSGRRAFARGHSLSRLDRLGKSAVRFASRSRSVGVL